ncbi:MAG: hypothetical protein AAFP82_09885 [Bacteroidota bacterium]
MEKHFELTNAEFEQQFASCELDPSFFSHEAHLRLAWIHIHKYGLEQAKKNIQEQLQNFVAHVGAKDKYNRTLTVAAIHAVSHFMQLSKADNFPEFIAEFPQLKSEFKALIATHYSFDVFNSAKAKTHFLVPDLMPFE